MASIFIGMTAIVAFVVFYAVWLRGWLLKQTWTARFFSAVEPLEIALFKKSETILIGRLLWVGGIFVTGYDGLAVFASNLDLTPLTTRAFDFFHIPPDMRTLAITALLAALGKMITWLRSRTTKPLEVVAVASKDVTPAVAQALVTAEVANTQAVAVVQEARAT